MGLSRRRGAAVRGAAAVLVALVVASVAPASRAEGGGAATSSPESEAFASWGAAGVSVFDILVLRPLGTAASAAGLGFFVAASPLAAVSGRIGTTWDIFVLGPVDYTFLRPLGDF
jgi:hypothetical protein